MESMRTRPYEAQSNLKLMKSLFGTFLVTLVLLSGCASGGGSLLPPQALPAHIYAPSEKLRPGPWQSMAMDGEVRYCATLDVMNGQVKGEELRKSALAQIGKACGGADNYAIVHQLSGDGAEYLGAGGLIRSRCPALTGRTLYFKCNRAITPAAPTR
jgi:hypothetical protein